MMTTLPTDYSHQQLVDALVSEYEWYIHDDYDEVFDNNPDKYRAHIQSMTHSQLINETATDDTYTIQEFMKHYG